MNSDSYQSKKNYGFLTVFVTIVGTVIGAGIFFKADSIYGTTGSTVISLVSWLITGFFILIITAALIEITSSSRNTDESGTLSNWAAKFVSPKFGVFVGIFLVFIYMPLTIVPLSYWTVEYIIEAVVTTNPDNIEEVTKTMYSFWIVLVMTAALLGVITIINFFSNRGSKAIQVVGTFIKGIPIIVILFSTLIFAFSGGSGDPNSSIESINDISKNESLNSDSFSQIFNSLMLAIPAVLFAYDGFIYAGSLQNETKKKGTFKRAMIIGMLFIAFVYTFLALGIYSAGDGTVEGGFSISYVMNSVFPNQPWITPFIAITIVISIGTGLNGFITTSNRSLSSLSETNLINDPEFKYQKRNKEGVPQRSALYIALVNVFWFIILFLISFFLTNENGGIFDPTAINILSEVGVTLSFFMIAIIFIGGLRNRKTDKVEVERSKFFIPSAVLSIVFIFLVVGYQFVGFFTMGDQYYLIVGIIIIIAVIIVYALTSLQVKKMEKKYDNKWSILCEYSEQLKYESNSQTLIDFNSLLNNMNHKARIHDYKSWKENLPPIWGQSYYDFIAKSISETNENLNNKFYWYGLKPYKNFYYKHIKKHEIYVGNKKLPSSHINGSKALYEKKSLKNKK